MKLTEGSNFYGTAGDAKKMQFPLNGPCDEETGIDRLESYISDKEYMNGCIYHRLGKTNEIAYYQPCERVIARLITPEVIKDIKGYGGYGIGKDGNFYADYYDGTYEEFNSSYAKNIKDFEGKRHIIFKIDGQSQKMSACVIGEAGFKEQLFLKSAPEVKMKRKTGHTACAVVFAIISHAITKLETNKLSSGGIGFEVSEIVFNHYKDVINAFNDNASVDDITKTLRCLDGDIYSIVKFNEEIIDTFGSNCFNSMNYLADEFPILEETSFPEMEIFHGDSAILGGRKVLASSGGFVPQEDLNNNKTINQILEHNPYALNPDRVLNELEKNMIPKMGNMVPTRQTLKIARMIKQSFALNHPFNNIIFFGESGSGKTTAVQHIAQLLNLPYCFVSFNPDTLLSDLYCNILPSNGKKDEGDFKNFISSMPSATEIALDPSLAYKAVTGIEKADASEEDCKKAIADKCYEYCNNNSDFMYVNSDLVEAFEKGYVVELQEVNLATKPGILAGLNAALDDLATIKLPTGEVIKRHPDCLVFMTANIDYEGTKKMNQAVLSRCDIIETYKIPTEESLINMIISQSGNNNEKSIKKMIRVMYAIRKVLEETGANDGVCGVRELISWATASMICGSEYQAALSTIVPHATTDSEIRTEVISALRTQFVS